MPFSPKSLEEKPYNVCLNCNNIGKHCDGPNFLAMPMDRLSEWCRYRKDYLHNQDPKWTNAYIAEQTGMSKVSVDRFLSGNIVDVKTSTAASIVKVLVNGSWGQYPCAMAEMAADMDYEDRSELVKRAEDAERKTEEQASRIVEMKGRIEFLREQLRSNNKLLEERTDFLRRKDRVIQILSGLLTLCILLFVVIFIYDVTHADIGFLQTY